MLSLSNVVIFVIRLRSWNRDPTARRHVKDGRPAKDLKAKFQAVESRTPGVASSMEKHTKKFHVSNDWQSPSAKMSMHIPVSEPPRNLTPLQRSSKLVYSTARSETETFSLLNRVTLSTHPKPLQQVHCQSGYLNPLRSEDSLYKYSKSLQMYTVVY